MFATGFSVSCSQRAAYYSWPERYCQWPQHEQPGYARLNA